MVRATTTMLRRVQQAGRSLLQVPLATGQSVKSRALVRATSRCRKVGLCSMRAMVRATTTMLRRVQQAGKSRPCYDDGKAAYVYRAIFASPESLVFENQGRRDYREMRGRRFRDSANK